LLAVCGRQNNRRHHAVIHEGLRQRLGLISIPTMRATCTKVEFW
jgi:hypothetical protein